jgi:hypothetical protein
MDISGSSFTIEMPDTSSEEMKKIVAAFVNSLLAKDAQAKWFSSRLKEASILKRLVHKWETSDVNPTHEWNIAHWSPTSLEVANQSFMINWHVTRFEESTPQISSRFFAVSRPESPTEEAVRQITIQPTPERDEMEIVNDIPFADFQEQMRDKNALQEARLRLALAKLKASRLSNTYYQKYGELYTDEAESEDEGEDSN